METMFTWKSKLFSSKYEIYKYDNPVGEISSKSWSRALTGRLNDRELEFKVKGVFRQDIEITDLRSDKSVARIVFNTWRSKATITYDNKNYYWKSDNLWKTKWSISNDNGPLVKYHSRIKKGYATSYTGDEVLIMAGLFIHICLDDGNTAAVAAGV